MFVNPFEVNEIKNAMLKLRNTPELQKQLIENGKQRKNNFSWDKSADLLWKSIEKTLK